MTTIKNAVCQYCGEPSKQCWTGKDKTTRRNAVACFKCRNSLIPGPFTRPEKPIQPTQTIMFN